MFDETFPELVNTAPEQIMYQFIQQLGGFIFYMSHDMADGRIPEENWPAIDRDICKAREESALAVSSLSRFGFSPVTPEGNPTPDYWKWYLSWNNYFKSMSDEDFASFNSACEAKQPLDGWRPAVDWRLA